MSWFAVICASAKIFSNSRGCVCVCGCRLVAHTVHGAHFCPPVKGLRLSNLPCQLRPDESQGGERGQDCSFLPFPPNRARDCGTDKPSPAIGVLAAVSEEGQSGFGPDKQSSDRVTASLSLSLPRTSASAWPPRVSSLCRGHRTFFVRRWCPKPPRSSEGSQAGI